jgi:hypothetical protein
MQRYGRSVIGVASLCADVLLLSSDPNRQEQLSPEEQQLLAEKLARKEARAKIRAQRAADKLHNTFVHIAKEAAPSLDGAQVRYSDTCGSVSNVCKNIAKHTAATAT